MPPWEKYQQQAPETTGQAPAGPWQKYAQPEQPARQGGGQPSALGFMNRPVADVLGFPMDAFNALTTDVGGMMRGAVGLDPLSPETQESMRLPGGREDFADIMQAMGADVAPEGAQPETFGQYVGRGVGETAAALPAFGGAARVVGQGTGRAAGFARDALETMARRPATSTAVETAAGAGAGAGGYTGNLLDPENPNAEVLGELAGGFGLPALGMMATTTPRLLYRGVRAGLTPFTETGGRIRAERRAQDVAQDPEAAARAIDEPVEGPLSPAERSRDPGLLALEKAVLDENPQLAGANAERVQEATDQLRNALADTGGDVSPMAARDFVEERADYLRSLVGQRARQAAARAEARLARIRPQQRQSEASEIVRDEVEKALADVKAQEGELWNAVPKDVEVPTSQIRQAYDALLADTPRAQQGNIPDIARRMLDPESNMRIGETDTINEIWGLRSELLDQARKARSEGDFQKARMADILGDAALDDLGATPGAVSGEAGEALRTALDFSREAAQRFRQGAVGRVLGRERTGGEAVDPALTLQRTVGQGGVPGAVAARELEETSFDTIAKEFIDRNGVVGEGVKQYLLSTFARRAVGPDGTVNQNAAARFVEDNKELLDRFPGLEDDILGARQAQDVAEAAQQRAQSVTKTLETPRISRTAEFLNARVGEEVDRIVKSSNPRELAREIRRKVARDGTGRAMEGLKAGAVDYLIRRSASGEIDDAGQPILSGRALRRTLADRNVRSAFGEILSDDQIRRVERIADELSRLERPRGGLPDVGGVIQDTPSTILSLAARTMAARTGAQMGQGTSGASLLTAGFFSQRARRMVERLTNDRAKALLVRAVQDPQLMRALLTETSNRRQQRIANTRLNAWLGGPGAEFAREVGLLPEEEQEERPSRPPSRPSPFGMPPP